MRENKINNIRRLLDVGSKSVEIETEESNSFIAPVKYKEEILKKLKPSLIVEEGETALEPIIYELPDGIAVKGLAKRTKEGKIIGILKAESNGMQFCSTKTIEFGAYDDLENDTKELALIMLKGNMRYNFVKSLNKD